MRTLLLFLLGLALAAPVPAQSLDGSLVEVSRQIETTPDKVQKEALAEAQKKHYLREVAPAGNPTVLLGGDMHLRIDGVPFVLYLRSTNHHTAAYVESRSLDVSEQTKQKAREFLQEVADRATSKRG